MSEKTKQNIYIAAISYAMVAMMILQGGTLIMVFRHLTMNPHPSRDSAEVKTALLEMKHTVQSLEHKIGELKLIEGFEIKLARTTAVHSGILRVAGQLSARVERLDITYGDQRSVFRGGSITVKSGVTPAAKKVTLDAKLARRESGVTPAAYEFTLVAKLARQEDLSKLVDGIKSQPWLLDIDKTESEGNRATIRGRIRRGFETGSGNT